MHLVLLLFIVLTTTTVDAFCNSRRKNKIPHKRLGQQPERRIAVLYQQQQRYGRGDEIWPPTNVDARIELSDSLVDPNQRPTEPSKLEYRRSIVTYASISISALAKVHADVSSFLPLDILVLIALSGYFLLLHRLEILPAPSTTDNAMLSIYQDPIGPTLGQRLEIWNRIGISIGVILPYLCILWNGDTHHLQSMLVRPLLIYCAQILTESICRETALPIRALVPIVYTAVRLCYYLYLAMTLDGNPGSLLVVLGWANVIFATIQLVLVLPYLALRYMRVHCFLVEAKSVELRSEASIGLTPK